MGEAGIEAEKAAGTGSLLNSEHPCQLVAVCEGAIVEEVYDEDGDCSGVAVVAAVVAGAGAGVVGAGEVEDNIAEIAAAVAAGADMVAGQPSAAEAELLAGYKVEDNRPQVGTDCTRVGAEAQQAAEGEDSAPPAVGSLVGPVFAAVASVDLLVLRSHNSHTKRSALA